MRAFLSILTTSFILIGCGGGGSGAVAQNSREFSGKNREITIKNNQSIYKIPNALSSNIELNIEGKKDIYLVVTSHFDNQDISISQGIVSANTPIKRETADKNSTKKVDTIKMRRDINEILFSNITNKPSQRQIVSRNRSIDEVNSGSKGNFCIDMDSSRNCVRRIFATAKKVVRGVNTEFGSKSLVIWLEDGNSLSQQSIDNLADTFLKQGSGNDIYDWETNIYGSEWGADAQNIDSKLIPKSDIIDILVYNMHNIGLAGYFWGKDNFKSSVIKASNEKIMFYINSGLLKKDPKETYTTLTHEFQHMIHFYQRSVIKGIEDSSWYDEMMSEATEDLISTKIGYMGPRHVDPYDGTAGRAGNRGGRYPNFNRFNTVALTMWQNTTRDYSKVSAFGAYLLRNYDGATLLNKLMYSNNQDEYAIMDATGENNFEDLISNWGAAVMLSNRVDAPNKYRYNFGDFKYSSFKGTQYELGSINFFNYNPQPQYKSSAKLGRDANLYYKVGNKLSGKVSLRITIPKGADITIISK